MGAINGILMGVYAVVFLRNYFVDLNQIFSSPEPKAHKVSL